MILATLNQLSIPYTVIKYKISSPITQGDVCRYRYQIIADCDIRLRRLGFNVEHDVTRYRNKIMFYNLKPREAEVFRLKGYIPIEKTESGTIWEFNGGIKFRYLAKDEVTPYF